MCCTVRNFQYTLSNVNREVLSQYPFFFFNACTVISVVTCFHACHVAFIPHMFRS